MDMTLDEIASRRLANQQLAGTKLTEPAAMVSYMGAMQAQDYAMAKWAVGVRTGCTDAAIEHILDTGTIVRTHLLRPTWHLVAATDIAWMLELTAPHVKTINNAMCRRYELDGKTLNRANSIIEKELAKDVHLTRNEIMSLLNKKDIPTDDIRSTLIMMNAELEGLVANGKRRGKELTYSLLDLSNAKKYTKEEGLAELAKRYFTSHGPATLQDFTWWSGLSITNAKAAVQSITSMFSTIIIDGQTYWFTETKVLNDKTPNIHFLPAFDEFIISYKDRFASMGKDSAKYVMTGNGIFKPIIVINGKVTGVWKRTIKKDVVTIETTFFDKITQTNKQAVLEAAEGYGAFMEMELLVK